MRVYASAEMTLTDTNDGVSVTGIDRYYMASSSSEGITVDSKGWQPDPQETNPISRYHWSYEVVNYSDGAKIPSKPAVIGVYGKDGKEGTDAVTVSLSSEAHTFAGTESRAIASSITIDISAFKGNQRISTSIGTVTGGISGQLTHSELGKGTTSNKLVINATSSLAKGNGTLSIPIVADGKTFNKVFSWSVAFKGKTGDKGDTGPQGPRGATGSQGPRGNTGTSVESITEYYLATSASSGIKSSNTGFKTTMQPMTATNKYLWNYEKINFSDGTSQPTIPVIIGVYGDKGQPGSTGATGRSISSITEHYLATSANSGVTRNTSGWDTKMQPTTETNRYLWNYETIKWSSAPLTTYVEPIIIGVHGAKGPQGPQGIQGIQGPKGANGQSQWVHIRYSANSNGSGMKPSPSDTTKYVGIAVTNSATAPAYTGFTWSKYVGENGGQGPQGVPGKNGANGKTTYTWVKYADTPTSEMSNFPEGKKYIGLAFNKITQTESDNNSDYQWSLMPQNIEIGGRNYFKGYKFNEEITLPNYQNVGGFIQIINRLTYPLEESNGKTFTISFEAISPNGNTPISVYNRNGNPKHFGFQANEIGTVTTAWRKFTATVTVVSTDVTNSTNSNRIEIYAPSKMGVKIRNIKVELGNKDTDWTPAPEDVTASIKAAQDKANAASNSASTANSLLTDIASDSKLTATEKKAAKKEWDIIVGEKPKIDSSANTYGIITEKTAYNTAYNTLNNYLSSLLANLNTTSNIVGTTFRSNFRAYYNARQDLLNKIADGAKSLVDEIEIGGENLFAITNTVSAFVSNGNISSSTEVHRTMSNLVDIGDTKSLMYQIWNPNKTINTANSNRVAFFTEANVYISTVGIPMISGSTYQMLKIQVPTNAKKARLGAIMGIGTIDPLIKIKFEKGNKATDWSPAPEDVYAYSDKVAQAKADAERIKAQSYADGKITAEEKKRIAQAEQVLKDAKAHALESIENIDIGGRNLIKNSYSLGMTGSDSGNKNVTTFEEGVHTITPVNNGNIYNTGVKPSIELVKGHKYTLSFDVSTNTAIGVYWYANTGGGVYSGGTIPNTKGEWIKHEFTYTQTRDSFKGTFLLGFHNLIAGSEVKYKNLKLEKGNVATDWTSAPEDIEQELANHQDQLDKTIDTDQLNTVVADINADKLSVESYESFLSSYEGTLDEVNRSIEDVAADIGKALSKTNIIETTLGEGAQDWLFTNTKIRMSDEGITLGDASSGTYLQISSERISFFAGATDEVAYVSGGMLYINKAIFVQSIQVAEYLISKELDGHLTYRFVGMV